MRFCTVINCMDGRVQIPAIEYLKKRFNVDYVDNITEPGPNLILFRQEHKALIRSILERVRISIEKHNSVGLAVVGHYDCAANQSSKERQLVHLKRALDFLGSQIDIPIIALWIDENWKACEVDFES